MSLIWPCSKRSICLAYAVQSIETTNEFCKSKNLASIFFNINKQWYHCRGWQMKGSLEINIFFQILLDNTFLIWLFMIKCMIKIITKVLGSAWNFNHSFLLIKEFIFLKWGMAKCVEKLNKLTNTVRTRGYFCRMI